MVKAGLGLGKFMPYILKATVHIFRIERVCLRNGVKV